MSLLARAHGAPPHGPPPPVSVPARAFFLPSPVSAPVAEDEYELRENYSVALPGLTLTIMRGYRTDFASIPRLFWFTTGYPSEPELQAPALIHDALYSAELLPRTDCDAVFHAALRLNGVGKYRAWKMWLGVRLGGGAVWRRHTPESVAAARLYCSLEVQP